MDFTRTQYLKTKASTWSLAFFSSALIVGVLASIFFQAPTKTNHPLNRFRTLIPSSHITSATRLDFTNRLGEFSLEKISDTEWMLIKPRVLPAKISTINLIFDALQNIKIKEVLVKDLINISNYSLELPLIKIKLNSSSSNQVAEQMEITFGLVNPIDNSTYSMLSQNDAIYHTSALDTALQSLALSDFVDSKIFPVSKENIASFQTYRGSPLRSDLKLSIFKDSNEFKNKRGVRLHPKRIFKFFDDIHAIKSYFLLDKQSPKLQEQLEKLTNDPLYTVIIESKDKTKYTFKISGTIHSLDGIKMEKRKYFLISASHRKYPYLVNKKSLRLFYKTQKSFKKMNIKKLFY